LSVLRSPAEKILDWDAARIWRQSLGRRKLVFTNGVFDLLHPGHVDVLWAARSAGDALIVGVNSDASVRRLKGPGRPVRVERDRLHVLAALGMVDAVVLFDQDTPIDLIRLLRPDEETIVGAADVRSWGGRVEVVPLTAGQSTTAIVEKLRGN
jgi:rfaE bifunctional protein nucleotidyltransferase chain/domain